MSFSPRLGSTVTVDGGLSNVKASIAGVVRYAYDEAWPEYGVREVPRPAKDLLEAGQREMAAGRARPDAGGAAILRPHSRPCTVARHANHTEAKPAANTKNLIVSKQNCPGFWLM